MNRLKPLRALFAFGFLNAFAGAAVACPFCHTETGQQVRAGIIGADFGFYLLVTLGPFAILLGIVALVYFGLPTFPIWSKAN